MDFLDLDGWETRNTRKHRRAYRVQASPIAHRDACPFCKNTNLYYFGIRQRLCRDLPKGTLAVTIEALLQRYRCRECGRTFVQEMPGILEDRKATARLAAIIQELAARLTFAEVGRLVRLDPKTVRTIFTKALEQRLAAIIPAPLRVLGIDEAMLAGELRATLCNIQEGTIIDILPTRRWQSVFHAIHALPFKAQIEVVTIDMWAPYLHAVRGALGDVPVVVDKFHVVRMADEALDRLRVDLARSCKHVGDAKRLRKANRIFRRHSHQVGNFTRLRMDALLQNWPVLADAYAAKEDFYDIYDARDRKDAEARYDMWRARLSPCLQRVFAKLLTATKNWRECMFAYFDFPHTNATTEALNGLIKRLNRNGMGYDFEIIKAKALLTHGVRKIVNVHTDYGWSRDLTGFALKPETVELDFGADIAALNELVIHGFFDPVSTNRSR